MLSNWWRPPIKVMDDSQLIPEQMVRGKKGKKFLMKRWPQGIEWGGSFFNPGSRGFFFVLGGGGG